MIKIQRKIVVDRRATPQEAFILRKQFCEMAEALGYDLDKEAAADLRATRKDWRQRKTDVFIPISKL